MPGTSRRWRIPRRSWLRSRISSTATDPGPFPPTRKGVARMALPNIDPIDRFAARMTDGAELQVRRYGNGTGPRLVISHGNGFAVDGYRVFWQPLYDDYDVVVFDIRNHGLNEPTGAD